MKIKSPHETAGIGKLHGYLGHFAKAKHINRGHNSDGLIKGPMSDKEAAGQVPQVVVTAKKMTADEASAYDAAQAKETSQRAKEAAAAKRAEDSQSKFQRVPVWSR